MQSQTQADGNRSKTNIGYHTIQQIAELIQQKLLSCEEFKEYTSWICCESYPDPDKHEQEADAIEKEWPTFKDDRELGHIPRCVWLDREEPHIWSDKVSMDELLVVFKSGPFLLDGVCLPLVLVGVRVRFAAAP